MNIEDIKIGDKVLFKRSEEGVIFITITYTLEKVERILKFYSTTLRQEETYLLFEGTNDIAHLIDVESSSLIKERKMEKVNEKEYKYHYLWD
ncbi:hypothetical protein [Metabacillus fastidiosus]|uniref:hypothetical protein n=1 Tax=Metabacillus fastidiosus TaxID=1458 RepID=UPI003D2A5760